MSQQRHLRRTQRQDALAVVVAVVVDGSRDPRYRRRGGAVAVRSGPRVPGKRLRAAEEHQPGGVPEPEQQQPGRDGRVQSGRQPERAGHRCRRRRGRRRRRQERAVDQVQQIVRERRARTARQHAQRRHTVAGRPEDGGKTADSMGSALQPPAAAVQRYRLLAVQRWRRRNVPGQQISRRPFFVQGSADVFLASAQSREWPAPVTNKNDLRPSRN